MRISYTNNAFAALASLINFIEDKNTKGAGLNWLNRYESFLEKSFVNAEQVRLCNNATFKTLGLKCIYFNDWVIAFQFKTMEF